MQTSATTSSRRFPTITRGLVCLLAAIATLVVPASAEVDADSIPAGAHHAAWLANQQADTNPAFIGQARGSIISLQPRSGSEPCHTVFGYLPYWETSAPQQWDKLTHLACFSVEVNANGTLGNLRGWPWDSIINEAHGHGVKVILVATLFDPADITTLITSAANRQRFYNNIRTQMLAGNVDGLNIDFESGSGWQSSINAFMAELSAELKTTNSDWEITFASPAVNWNNRFDLPGLADSCDGLFVMGYAFAGSWSSATGPNSPLEGGSINITDTIDDEYAGVDREKMILGVPYYGHHWRTSGSEARSSVVQFMSSTRFFDDEPNALTYGRLWDATSQTPWYRWFDGSSWNQVWYDDAESLGLKYDLALNRGLAGVGMWALGYDEGRQELWNAIEASVGSCEGGIDLNGDGVTDNQDRVLLSFCTQGPSTQFNEGNICRNCDFDGDEDVDLIDVSLIQDSW